MYHRMQTLVASMPFEQNSMVTWSYFDTVRLLPAFSSIDRCCRDYLDWFCTLTARAANLCVYVVKTRRQSKHWSRFVLLCLHTTIPEFRNAILNTCQMPFRFISHLCMSIKAKHTTLKHGTGIYRRTKRDNLASGFVVMFSSDHLPRYEEPFWINTHYFSL